MLKKLLYLLPALLIACTPGVKTTQVLLTAESGEKCEEIAPITFEHINGEASNAEGNKHVVVDLEDQRQVIDGYGVSLTE